MLIITHSLIYNVIGDNHYYYLFHQKRFIKTKFQLAHRSSTRFERD